MENVLREFSAAAECPAEVSVPCWTSRSLLTDPQTKLLSQKPHSGALLFAVVGAKLSEGLNFSDGLARAVAIVGLPFANLGSAELQARMKYVREHNGSSAGADAGKELYENL